MEFNQVQEKAWEILTKREQMALSLIVVNERSQREASEIMGLSQYKFLEVYLRARKFFELFFTFFEKVGEEYDLNLLISKRDFNLILRIFKERKTFTKIIYSDPTLISFTDSSFKQKFWENIFFSLRISKSEKAKVLLDTLITYDKWNNFRILPPPFRSLSPFPRRRNKVFKKIKKNVESLSELAWFIFEREFKVSKGNPKAFVPRVFSNKGPEVLAVSLVPNSFKYFTKNRIPLFKDEKTALKFAGVIHFYNSLNHKSSYSAKKFWSNFRVLLSYSLNYNELLGIIPGELLELSVKDKEFIKKAVKQQKPKRLKKVKRAPEHLFY